MSSDLFVVALGGRQVYKHLQTKNPGRVVLNTSGTLHALIRYVFANFDLAPGPKLILKNHPRASLTIGRLPACLFFPSRTRGPGPVVGPFLPDFQQFSLETS